MDRIDNTRVSRAKHPKENTRRHTRNYYQSGSGPSPPEDIAFRHAPTGIIVSGSEMFRALRLVSHGTSRVRLRHSREDEAIMELVLIDDRLAVKLSPCTALDRST